MGEWKPLMTILSLWTISSTQREVASRASDEALREAKKATNGLFSKS
jgi:hypothetical protein